MLAGLKTETAMKSETSESAPEPTSDAELQHPEEGEGLRVDSLSEQDLRDSLLSFGLDDEEPLDDFDPIDDEFEAVELENTPMAFDDVEIDTSSYERWVQSCLKSLVSPNLKVDGDIGYRTRLSVKKFQRRARRFHDDIPKLTVDGLLGRKTHRALELATSTKKPSITEEQRAAEAQREPAPPQEPARAPEPEPTISGSPTELAVRTEDSDKGVVYVISDGRQEVRFRYWGKDRGGRRDPYNVSRYRGGIKNLVSFEALERDGYSRSEYAILAANALKESGGKFGAMNTWDNQIVSWGMAQFAGHAGTLAKLMSYLKKDARSRAAYERCFVANGVDVAFGKYEYVKKGEVTERKGWHVVVQAPGGKSYAGDPGWAYLRTQPKLVGAFMIAGNDESLAIGQCLFWRDKFVNPVVNKIVGRDGDFKGARANDYVTSEYGMAMLVRLGNWMPVYVRRWTNEFIDELVAAHGDEIRDPASWNAEIETEFIEKVKDRRRAVKKGSYDTYALDVSRERDSFKAGEDRA